MQTETSDARRRAAGIAATIAQCWPELAALGVEHLDLIGSAARDELLPDSDIDVVVHLAEPLTFRRILAVRTLLIEKLGRAVDVLTPGAVASRPRFLKHVQQECVRVA